MRGLDLRRSHPVLGPRGKETFEIADISELERSVALTAGCDLDDTLTPTVLRSLCVRFGVPPDDFHLDPSPDDD